MYPQMTLNEFLGHCFAQGGNWTRMLMTGIQNLYPEYYEQMPDKTYEFEDIVKILKEELNIVWQTQ